MKIALVSTNEGRHGLYPMGIMYMASYVRNILPDIEFHIYDFVPELSDILSHNYDIIGISSMTVHYNNANKFGKTLREKYSGTILLGGIHFSLTQKLPLWADIGVVGEGEITFLELVRLFNDEGKFRLSQLNKINGIVYRNNHEHITTRHRERINDIDTITFPARDLVDMEYYLKPNNTFGTKVGRGLSIMTSRGCNFRCEFCSTSLYWGNTRYHSAKYVTSEIKHLVDNYQVQYLYCVDDNFCSNKKRLKEMADEIEKDNIRVEIGASGRIEYYDDEMRDIYRRIGVKALSFGFETGSERMLRKIKCAPKLTVKETVDMAKRIIDDGIEVQGMFMLNMPGETLEDLQLTVKMIKEIPMSKLGITIAMPFYGTQWWELALEQGIVPQNPDDSFWDVYDLKLLEKEKPLFKTDIKREDLFRIYDELIEYQRGLFYFDWKNRE